MSYENAVWIYRTIRRLRHLEHQIVFFVYFLLRNLLQFCLAIQSLVGLAAKVPFLPDVSEGFPKWWEFRGCSEQQKSPAFQATMQVAAKVCFDPLLTQ